MFGLTKDERMVILFLLSVALAGAGADFLAKIYSPSKTVAGFTQEIGKVDLNKADKSLLMSVPGIGEKLAQRIIEYRDREKGFCRVEELKNIKGITGYRFEKIKDFLKAR